MSTLDANHTKFSSRLYSCLTGMCCVVWLELSYIFVFTLHNDLLFAEIRNSNNPVPYNPRFVRLLLAKFNPNFEGNDEQV